MRLGELAGASEVSASLGASTWAIVMVNQISEIQFDRGWFSSYLGWFCLVQSLSWVRDERDNQGRSVYGLVLG